MLEVKNTVIEVEMPLIDLLVGETSFMKELVNLKDTLVNTFST